MRFELKVAIRHLLSERGQTLLTMAAVAVAVTVIVFITCLISGLQRRLLNTSIGSLPHVTVKPPEPRVVLLFEASPARGHGSLPTSTVERQVDRRLEFQDPSLVERQLSNFPGVVAIVPSIRGQAFLVHGAKQFGVSVSGADPAQQERIAHLQQDMTQGRWLGLGPDEVAIGFRLAEEAGVRLGDRVRVTSSEGVADVFTVGGIFDTGQNATDLGTVFVTLRSAQRLFRMGRYVGAVQVKLEDPFQANTVADAVSGALGYKTESWMREQAQFLTGLRAQNSSSLMICAFALLASAFSIAAVLIVSVIQKKKEIGILKSMGAHDRQIAGIFALEGLGIAVLGSLMGCGTGYLLLLFLSGIRQATRFGKSDALFTIDFSPSVFIGAAAAAILATLVAAIMPARRAARMDPVEILHGN